MIQIRTSSKFEWAEYEHIFSSLMFGSFSPLRIHTRSQLTTLTYTVMISNNAAIRLFLVAQLSFTPLPFFLCTPSKPNWLTFILFTRQFKRIPITLRLSRWMQIHNPLSLLISHATSKSLFSLVYSVFASLRTNCEPTSLAYFSH